MVHICILHIIGGWNWFLLQFCFFFSFGEVTTAEFAITMASPRMPVIPICIHPKPHPYPHTHPRTHIRHTYTRPHTNSHAHTHKSIHTYTCTYSIEMHTIIHAHSQVYTRVVILLHKSIKQFGSV